MMLTQVEEYTWRLDKAHPYPSLEEAVIEACVAEERELQFYRKIMVTAVTIPVMILALVWRTTG